MNSTNEPSPDPVYRSSLREMKWIIVSWTICFFWVIGYTGLYGYPPPDQPLTTVIGMPSWVFWGVFLPWVLAAVFSSWFALTQIQDHPLDDSVACVTENSEPENSEPVDG